MTTKRFFAFAGAAFIFFACGTNANRETASNGPDGGIIEGDPDAGFSSDDFFANDPPPKYCGKDPAKAPAPPGGTPDCPDDKNRKGCPCPKVGEKAPCWPGLRKNRGLGQCVDGTTTCLPVGELDGVWGKCEGAVLPVPGATKGKEACNCFSEGQWKLDNLSPCFVQNSDGTYAAVSTDSTGKCVGGSTFPPAAPSGLWTNDSLKVDCAGHFKLCYTLKAGKADAPSATDCVLSSVCTESDYDVADKEQIFPALKSWASPDFACAKKFAEQGGYGEMSVKGQSIQCDDIGDNGQPLVFLRSQYCPLTCAKNPSDPACSNCQNGGSGQF